MSYSTPDADNFISDGGNLIEGYNPFIADVTLSSPCEPFHFRKQDFRSEEELDRVRHSLGRIASQKEFNPPLPLSDYCLVAKQNWDDENMEEPDFQIRLCSVQ